MRLPLRWQYPSSQETVEFSSKSDYIHKLQETLNDIRIKVEENSKLAIQRQAEYYNNMKRSTPIAMGTQVLVKREGHLPGKFPLTKFKGPYEVVGKVNEWSYKLKNMQTGEIIDRNYNQIKALQNQVTIAQDVATWATSIQSKTIHRARTTQQYQIPPTTAIPSSSPSVQPANRETQQAHQSARRYPVRQRLPPSRLRRIYFDGEM
jgi:hypothetical protein